MKVSVFGLGYVGSVSAASFAADGHEVVGVDVNADKVAAVNAGRSPIVEPGSTSSSAERVAEGACARRRTPPKRCTRPSVSLICVGTPSQQNGSLEPRPTSSACARQIGEALAGQADLPRRRRPQHGAAGHDARAWSSRRSSARRARGTAKASASRSTRSSCAKGTALKDFRKPPLTLVGHNHAAGRERHDRALPVDRRAARQHEHPRRRDDRSTRATPGTR